MPVYRRTTMQSPPTRQRYVFCLCQILYTQSSLVPLRRQVVVVLNLTCHLAFRDVVIRRWYAIPSVCHQTPFKHEPKFCPFWYFHPSECRSPTPSAPCKCSDNVGFSWLLWILGAAPHTAGSSNADCVHVVELSDIPVCLESPLRSSVSLSCASSAVLLVSARVQRAT